jgi:hypothetical protein
MAELTHQADQSFGVKECRRGPPTHLCPNSPELAALTGIDSSRERTTMTTEGEDAEDPQR